MQQPSQRLQIGKGQISGYISISQTIYPFTKSLF